MLLKKWLTGCLLMLATTISLASESISFPSEDGLLISADLYAPHRSNTAPLILLFHQAGSSRGEYDEIAPRLNNLGFNCIAVDLRSGKHSRGKNNATASRASQRNLSTNYADALPDVIATLRYARQHYNNSKTIAWGSSYSAALVLKVAGDYPQLVDGVVAFSPGEYFSQHGESKTWIRDSAEFIRVPTFITSARKETADWAPIYDVIEANNRHRFVPQTAGNHGSKALWRKQPDSSAYWQAVSTFLKTFSHGDNSNQY